MRRDTGRQSPLPADPVPERRLARLLAAFIAAGLFYLVLPGTLLGVWNLVYISSRQDTESISLAWIQAHGHAQLFGWVGTFMIGISLYTVPKFRGAWIRSLPAAWAMFALWTVALAARWAAAVWDWHWRVVWPVSAGAELAVALSLVWQCTPRSASRRAVELWERLIFAGFTGLIVTLGLQLVTALGPLRAPVIPPEGNGLLLYLALWTFCLPVAWGFSARFLPSLLGLARPDPWSAHAGLALLGAGAAAMAAGWHRAGAALTLAAVIGACRSLRIFAPSLRPAKVNGVDPRYPWFARAAFAWLVASAALALASSSPGMTGASRHAFTVGFLGTLILAIGPRILPAFMNSRELWSPRLMLVSLAALAMGCTLRVVAEPLAYAGAASAAWSLLPVSAVLELGAVLLFAVNIGVTLALPMPVWIERHLINEKLNLYWCVTAYPATRRLLERAGLFMPGRAALIPRTLTLGEAAAAQGVDSRALVAALREYFERRVPRAMREKRREERERYDSCISR